MDRPAVVVSAPHPSEKRNTSAPPETPRTFAALKEAPIDWDNYQPIDELYPFLKETSSPRWDDILRGSPTGIETTLTKTAGSSVENQPHKSKPLCRNEVHDLELPSLDATADEFLAFFQPQFTNTPPALSKEVEHRDVAPEDLGQSNVLPIYEVDLNEGLFDAFADYRVGQSSNYQDLYQNTYDAAAYPGLETVINPPGSDFLLGDLPQQSLYPPLSIAAEPIPAYGNQYHQGAFATQTASESNQYLDDPGPYDLTFDSSNTNDPRFFLGSRSNMRMPTHSAPAPIPTPALSQPNIQARPSRKPPTTRGPAKQYLAAEELVNTSRSSKRSRDPSCDPRHFYTARIPTPAPWGTRLEDSRPSFIYGEQGQLASDRVYSTDQLREYVESNRATFWVQNAPAQCNNRMNADDRRCRWDQCPSSGNLISAGWLRIAFDEFATETSNGTKDPFKVAGVMHLWCFEQCFDLVDLYSDDKLQPESRLFPKETKNAMSLERDRNENIICDAYGPWFKEHVAYRKAHGAEKMPRKHADTLSCKLIQQHLDNQTPTRQRARAKRNQKKPEDAHKTIDVHKGDLRLYTQIHKQTMRKVNFLPLPVAPVAPVVHVAPVVPVAPVVSFDPLTTLRPAERGQEGSLFVGSEGHPTLPADQDSLFGDLEEVYNFTVQTDEPSSQSKSVSHKRKRSDDVEIDEERSSKRSNHGTGQDRKAAGILKVDTYITSSGMHLPMPPPSTRPAFSPRRSPRKPSPRKITF